MRAGFEAQIKEMGASEYTYNFAPCLLPVWQVSSVSSSIEV